MSTAMEDPLEKAREQAQELHKKIDAARNKAQDSMRAELAAVATQAGELSATVRDLAARVEAL